MITPDLNLDFLSPPHLKQESVELAKHVLATKGYCHIQLMNSDGAREVTISEFYQSWVSLIGNPIRVFNRLDGIWRTIGVRLDKHPNSSGGIGESPLHIDFVNSTMPPDVVCLLCVEPDPYGGGESLVSNYSSIVDELTPEDISILSRPIYQDGRFEDLINIGEEWNPFPVLSSSTNTTLRFTEKLANLALSGDALRALNYVKEYLRSRMLSIPLGKNDLLILNQRQVAHGKTSLGLNQSEIPERSRRKLLQLFVRL